MRKLWQVVERWRSARIGAVGVAVVGVTCVVGSIGPVLAQAAWPEPKVRASKSAQPAPSTAIASPPAPVTAPQAPAASQDAGHAAGVPAAKDALAAKAGNPSPMHWSATEIEQAQQVCVATLSGMDIVAVGVAPMREGECGAAAPIELISVGKGPQVTFNPPVVVTCDMAAGLHKWVVGELQPLAKKHLGAPLIRIETMSSYSCRNAYGRRMAKLSEHGKANAIDIRAFLTAKADAADVLANWGPTERDVAAQIAAAKAAAQKQPTQVAQPAAPVVAPGQGQPALAGGNPVASGSTGAATAVADQSRPGITFGIPGAPGSAFPSSAPSAIGLQNGFPQPNRLGGPKAAESPALRGALSQSDGRMMFLKGAHTSACKVFGTVLGPESNNAHRNHFHVDMAKRTSSSFCE